MIGNATVLNLWNALLDVSNLRQVLDYEKECTQFHDSHDKRRALNDGYMRKIVRESCNDIFAFSMLVLARRLSQPAKST